MIVGNKYLVGDGGGYDLVICLGPSSQKEIADYGRTGNPELVVQKVQYCDGRGEDIFFETPGVCELYIEPRD